MIQNCLSTHYDANRKHASYIKQNENKKHNIVLLYQICDAYIQLSNYFSLMKGGAIQLWFKVGETKTFKNY